VSDRYRLTFVTDCVTCYHLPQSGFLCSLENLKYCAAPRGTAAHILGTTNYTYWKRDEIENLEQGYTNAECQAAMATRSLMAAPSILKCILWNFVHVKVVESRILRWLLDFLENLCISDLEASGSPTVFDIDTTLGHTYIRQYGQRNSNMISRNLGYSR
jgi:hypothetical protein